MQYSMMLRPSIPVGLKHHRVNNGNVMSFILALKVHFYAIYNFPFPSFNVSKLKVNWYHGNCFNLILFHLKRVYNGQ